MLIEVYGDVVCPWCYIGEHRLSAALAQRPDLQVERVWRPFQLQPDMVAEGKDWAIFSQEKFGGKANAQAAFAQVTEIGHELGLNFDFDRVVSAPNTVDAHRLILWAAEQGRQWEMVEALFKAYFTEGRNLNRENELLDIAQSVGFEPEETRSFLKSELYRPEVLDSQEEAFENDIHSVPQFIIAGRYRITGAQPVEVLVRALDYIAQQSTKTKV